MLILAALVLGGTAYADGNCGSGENEIDITVCGTVWYACCPAGSTGGSIDCNRTADCRTSDCYAASCFYF